MGEWRPHQSIGLVTRHGISSPDARTTTPRRSRRDPGRAVCGLPGAAQGNCRRCAVEEAASGYPIPWADAVQTLAGLLDQFEEWRDKLPSSLANSPTAEALDAVLELRGHVEDLQAVELPKGFGRD